MKLTDAQKKKIRQSARGEECTLQINGVCNYNPETTVYAHLPSEWKGMGLKSPDLACGVYACHSCHLYIDAQFKRKEGTYAQLEWFMRRALQRTIKRMFEKGIIKV